MAASKPDTETSKAPNMPPIGLVYAILFCSGALLMFALRDLLATGRNIAGPWDEAYLVRVMKMVHEKKTDAFSQVFTKSTDWFQDEKGWKSRLGGFSAVEMVSTDSNNMGGFFVRKLAGAAAVGVQLQKLWPFVVHSDAQWPWDFYQMLEGSLMGNLMTILLYVSYLDVFRAQQAEHLVYCFLGLLTMESMVMALYLIPTRKASSKVAVAMKKGETPDSFVSKIVLRTVGLVSGLVALVSLRDLLAPGFILSYFPRDDIYLEWTNALLHSPPENSAEALEHGLEAVLLVGDKFMSQLMALNLLILCLHRFNSAFMIRLGSDKRGTQVCKRAWQPLAISGALITFVVRVFQPAAASASLDLRYHLMFLAYETFVLGIYGFA